MGFQLLLNTMFSKMIDLIKLVPIISYLRSRSYSQFWEDRLIARNLSTEIGSYVDIGAGAPIWGSNTYLFYKKGWAGVTVDPVAFNMKMQKLFRPRDRRYESVVSSSSEIVEFYQLSPWELSTLDSAIARERISNGSVLIKKHSIKPISLDRIYRENPIKRPAILSIDVEGAEFEVLKSNNWETNKPDIICIEELKNPLDTSEVKEFLSLQDYELGAYNGVSSIYIWRGSEHIA